MNIYADDISIIQNPDNTYSYYYQDKPISNQKFLSNYSFHNNLAPVKKLNNLWNIITINGNFLSREDFLDIKDACGYKISQDVPLKTFWLHKHNLIVVKRQNQKWNFLKLDGTFLLQYDLEDAWQFECNVALVKLNENSYNFITPDGKFLSKTHFLSAHQFTTQYNIPFSVVRDANNHIFLIDNQGLQANNIEELAEIRQQYESIKNLITDP